MPTIPIILMSALLASPLQTERRNLAAEVFEYLREHCLPLEEDPSQWQGADCYSMHKTARELYSDKPLSEIEPPDSNWDTGSYRDYYNPIHFMKHEWLRARVYIILNVGRSGIPPRK